MKILYVLDKPNLYGSEQHVLRLMDTLKEEDDIQLLAFSSGPLLNKLQNKGIPYSIIEMKWYSLSKLRTLLSFFKSHDFHIIHAHQPKAMFWCSIAGYLASIPCIITVHSLPSSNIQSYSNFLKKCVVGLFHHFVKFTSEIFATRVIYLSGFSLRSAIFKSKSLIIPNWINLIIGDEKVKASFSDPIRFISVGSVTYNKGMDRMIEALGLIKNFNWEIQIVGDSSPEYQMTLMNSAVRLDIAERISFLGYREDVTQLMLDADGFILLSRGETFGLVYIEAMNCGLPIIAWDIPAVQEIVPPGNVVMSQPADISAVFNSFYSSKEKYETLSLTNREFVKSHYSLDKIKIIYRNLYDQILSNNRN